MATLTVEGLPEQLVARLAKQAAAHGRGVNSELIVLLTRALATRAPQNAEPAGRGACRSTASGAVAPGERARIGWGGP